MRITEKVKLKWSLLSLITTFQICSSVVEASFFPEPYLRPDTQDQIINASENFIYDEYVVIDSQFKIVNDSPDEIRTADVNLLSFKHETKTFPLPVIKYDRKKQFGGWIRFADDGSCLDTRGLVLERDSLSGVDVVKCRVTAGDWYDPYTDKKFASSGNIQIDHLVPLKHAYMTGAYQWSQKKRCQYANYLGNKVHLLPVSSSENMRKSDRGPREYIPPNRKYTCEYLKNWLYVKYIWELKLTPIEVTEIQKSLQQEHCDMKDFKISKTDIAEQRKYMKDHENICVGTALTAF
jgi:hypothetical protein